MHRSRSFGYFVYPALVLFFLFAPETVAISSAQSMPGTVPDAASQSASPDSSQPPPQSTASQPVQQSTPRGAQQSTSQQPVRSAPQDAAARIRARRQQRVAQAIHEIYDHKYEAFGGGGYLRFRPGSSLQKINEVLWDAGVTDYLSPNLGITVDFRGQYGTAYTYNNPYLIYSPSIWQYTGLAGPQYRIHRGQRYGVSARVLAGASYGNFDGGAGGRPASLLGLYSNGSALSIGAGVPLDYNLSPALAVRLTPEYFLTRFGSEFQQNRGFQLGVIYRFGHQ